MKKFFTLACVFAIAATSWAQLPAGIENVALNKAKVISYSSFREGMKSRDDAGLFDGDLGSKWCSDGQGNSAHPWIVIDLNQSVEISAIAFRFEQCFAKNYTIYATNDNTVANAANQDNNDAWTEAIYNVEDLVKGEGNPWWAPTIDFATPTQSYRFLKLYCDELDPAMGNAWGWGIMEMQIAGTSHELTAGGLESVDLTVSSNAIYVGQVITLKSVGKDASDIALEGGEVTYYVDGEAIEGSSYKATTPGEHTIYATITLNGITKQSASTTISVKSNILAGLLATTNTTEGTAGTLSNLTDGVVTNGSQWGVGDGYGYQNGELVAEKWPVVATFAFDGQYALQRGLISFNRDNASAKDFSIEYSADANGDSWTTIAHENDNNTMDYNFEVPAGTHAYYFRIVANSSRVPAWGMKICEMFLEGKKVEHNDGVLTTIVLSTEKTSIAYGESLAFSVSLKDQYSEAILADVVYYVDGEAIEGIPATETWRSGQHTVQVKSGSVASNIITIEVGAPITITPDSDYQGFANKVEGVLNAEALEILTTSTATSLDLRNAVIPTGTVIKTANDNVVIGVNNSQVANIANASNVVSLDLVGGYNVAVTPLVFDESKGKIWSAEGRWIDARQGADYSRTIAAGTYATVAALGDVETLPKGLKVYEFTGIDNDMVTFTEATRIAKDVPYIVYADGHDVTFTAHANNGDVIKSDNERSVVNGNVTFHSNYVAFQGTAEGNLYGLSAGETSKTLKHIGASANVGPFRGYFVVEGAVPSNVRFVDSTLTTIATVATSEIEGLTFNLAGQRVNNANGIVIKNGKKVIR